MSGSLRVGVVGGSGWLGTAIAKSMLDSGFVHHDALTLSYRSSRSDVFPGVHWTTDNQKLADRSDVIVLSVRPADWTSLSLNVDSKLIISVMAGITLTQLSQSHGTSRVVRAMPNAAAEVHQSWTPWVASPNVDRDDRSVVRHLFNACGTSDEVQGESQIDYLSGLAGSGPAFPALLAKAMHQHAVSRGISEELAQRAVVSLLVGTGRLFERLNGSPSRLVEAFLDFQGTTAAAIEAMQGAGFTVAIERGLEEAERKSVSLGEQISGLPPSGRPVAPPA